MSKPENCVSLLIKKRLERKTLLEILQLKNEIKSLIGLNEFKVVSAGIINVDEVSASAHIITLFLSWVLLVSN